MVVHNKDIYLIAKALLLSLFFLSISINTVLAESAAFFKFNTFERQAYHYVLNLEFNEARSILNKNNINSTVRCESIYIANLADVTELYISEDPLLYEAYQSNEKTRLNAAAKLQDDNPEKLFLQSELKIHWAFVKLKFGRKLAAFRNLQQAYRLITKNQQLFPEFIPNFKSLGVLHTLFDAIPDQYNWIRDLLGLQGNTSKGLKELNIVRQEHTDFTFESLIYASVFEAFLLNKKQNAIEGLQNSMVEYKHFSSYKLILALLYIKNAQSNLAHSILKQMINRAAHPIKFQLLNYYLAETMLHKGDYEQALNHYKSFIKNFTGTSLIKDAYFKTAICYYLLDDEMYTNYMDLAVKHGNTSTGRDRNADKMLADERLPDKILLKVRYATDGGYYAIADSILAQRSYKDYNHQKFKTEYYYRKARLHHKMGAQSQAEGYYLKTILSQSTTSWYFAPNSCLQLGYIYLEERNYQKAKTYFNKAKSYKDHPYRYSIDKKADIGIKWIKEDRTGK